MAAGTASRHIFAHAMPSAGTKTAILVEFLKKSTAGYVETPVHIVPGYMKNENHRQQQHEYHYFFNHRGVG